MITGYNTDVRYREKVFHVQTEDKGLKNPQLETVVYVGGQVLLAKRTSYADLIEAGQGEAEIAARMDQQHRMMLAAVKTGRLDKKMVEARIFTEEQLAADPVAAAPAAKPAEPSLLEVAKEDSGPTLDQVILDYLTTEAQQDSLELKLEGEPILQAGMTVPVRLRAESGKTGLPVSGARVTVRLISTVREPETLGEGMTDEDGSLRLEVEIPVLDRGAAAIIVSGTSLVGGAELKYLL